MGVLVEELQTLRPEIVRQEGRELGEAVVHLLAFAADKFANYNSVLASWHAPRAVMLSVFDRHDYSFKATFCEMAPCGAGVGLDWAIDNVVDSYEHLAALPRDPNARSATITLGSATSYPRFPTEASALWSLIPRMPITAIFGTRGFLLRLAEAHPGLPPPRVVFPLSLRSH